MADDELTVEAIRAKLKRQIDYEELKPDEAGVIGRFVPLLDDSFTVAEILVLLDEIDRLRAPK